MAENKKYFWFKLKEDFFQSKEMKILRKMPSGSDMIVVLLKLQLHALKTNGVIEIDGLCSNTEEELSILIDEDTNLIKMSLMALNKFSLLNLVDGKDIKMLLHDELVGKETASTIRSRKSRSKEKIEYKKEEKTLLCNTGATNCNTEIEIDKDIELELEYFTDEQKLKINKNYPNIDLFYYEERIKEWELKTKPYSNRVSALNTFVKRDIKQRNSYEKKFVELEKQPKQEYKIKRGAI